MRDPLGARTRLGAGVAVLGAPGTEIIRSVRRGERLYNRLVLILG